MKVVFQYRDDSDIQMRAMFPLAESVRRDGCQAVLRGFGSPQAYGDLNFVWGIRNKTKSSSLAWVVLECGYINGEDEDYKSRRHAMVSYSVNGMHYDSMPTHTDMDSTRWDALGISLAPWKHGTANMLVLMQNPGDAQCGLGYPELMAAKSEEARQAGWRVRVREHPLVCESAQPPLSEDLAWADAALTWCSNAAVEAVIAGVPTVMLSPQGMAYSVCSHSLSAPLQRPNRDEWCNWLAHRQFSFEEIGNGVAWQNIKKSVLLNHPRLEARL